MRRGRCFALIAPRRPAIGSGPVPAKGTDCPRQGASSRRRPSGKTSASRFSKLIRAVWWQVWASVPQLSLNVAMLLQGHPRMASRRLAGLSAINWAYRLWPFGNERFPKTGPEAFGFLSNLRDLHRRGGRHDQPGWGRVFGRTSCGVSGNSLISTTSRALSAGR